MKTIIILLLLCGTASAHPLKSDDATSITYQPNGVWSIVAKDGTHKHYVDGTEVSELIYDQAKITRANNKKDFEKQFDKLLKAFALLVFEEINKLRQKAGMTQYTLTQFKTAVRNKYETL